MIAIYVVFLGISIIFFYFTSGLITSATIRFVVATATFVVLSTAFTIMVSKGHAPPPGAKTVDIEEMKKIRRESKGK